MFGSGLTQCIEWSNTKNRAAWTMVLIALQILSVMSSEAHAIFASTTGTSQLTHLRKIAKPGTLLSRRSSTGKPYLYACGGQFLLATVDAFFMLGYCKIAACGNDLWIETTMHDVRYCADWKFILCSAGPRSFTERLHTVVHCVPRLGRKSSSETLSWSE